MTLGKKILVVGVSASGKSIFSRELGKKLSIPVTHIDSLMWKPGWEYIGGEETIKLLNEISQRPIWIIEGFIDKEALPFMLERADTTIYLDYSSLTTAWRYLKRCWLHRKNSRPELEGSPDKFDLKFLRTIWQKKEVYYLNKSLKTLPNKTKLLKLTSPTEAKRLLGSI